MVNIDIDVVYKVIDKMKSLKRYKPPTAGFFPTVGEINTYALDDNFDYMIPYIMWLDDCLTDAQREEHKDAVRRFNQILSQSVF